MDQIIGITILIFALMYHPSLIIFSTAEDAIHFNIKYICIYRTYPIPEYPLIDHTYVYCYDRPNGKLPNINEKNYPKEFLYKDYPNEPVDLPYLEYTEFELPYTEELHYHSLASYPPSYNYKMNDSAKKKYNYEKRNINGKSNKELAICNENST